MMEKRVPVEVAGIYAHEDAGVVSNHFVLFRDEAKRRIPIFIGQFEAWAISLGLEDKPQERPFTHDAMIRCLSVAGAVIEEVYINDVRDETYYSVVSLRIGGQMHQVDIRPSDAISLALRAKCPILMNEKIIEAAKA